MQQKEKIIKQNTETIYQNNHKNNKKSKRDIAKTIANGMKAKVSRPRKTHSFF